MTAYENELFLGDNLLSGSDTSLSLDITSSENVLRGDALAQKKIVEGKVTLNTASSLLFSLPSPLSTPATSLLIPDRTKWDFYLVVIPFTIEIPPGSSNFYREVTFYIDLTTPNALAFDLFPKSIITSGEERKTYGLSPDYRIQELEEHQEYIGRIMRFALLPPKITAFGQGNTSFYWLYEGLTKEDQRGVPPGIRQVLIVLQVPHGTQVVDGDISYKVVVAKRLLGMWQNTQATTNAYPIHWQLNATTQFSLPSPAPQKVSVNDTANAPFDICIVCAMVEELEAFIKVVEQRCNVRFQNAFSRRTNREYMHTTIRNKQGETLRVHASWQASYGPLEVGLHLRPILEEFLPRFVAMTGICAGDKRKVKLGDIIVAERAFLYDSGKFVLDENGQQEHLRDTDTWRSYPEVLHMVRLFSNWKQEIGGWSRPPSKHQQRDWLISTLLKLQTPRIDAIPPEDLKRYAPAWRVLVRELQSGEEPYLTANRMLRDPAQVQELRFGEEEFPYQDPPEPKVYIAPMASGSAVRADRPFADVQIPVRGTLAVDMEGAAFYRTVDEFSSIRSLLVKGVSDYADRDKDDSYRSYAAQVSAAYVLAFIQEFVTSERMPNAQSAEVHQGAQRSGIETIVPPPTVQPFEQPEATFAVQEEEQEFNAIRVFFSYAPRDETLARELEKHLALLKRQGLITSWHSHRVIAGQEPEQEIKQQLHHAQIILLLISPDFLFSDEQYTEMTAAVKERNARTVAVIPVLLRATEGLKGTPIEKLLMLPRNNKPIQQWNDRDAAFAEVAREIRTVVTAMMKRS